MSKLLETTLKNFTHTRQDRPPIRLRNYPHLIGGDSELWDKFLVKNPSFFEAVSYDVRVGEGMVLAGEWSQEIADMAKTLSQRRIDVIAERAGYIWLIELKVDPGVSLIGQLEAYKILFLKELEKPVLIQMFTIINRTSPDLTTVLNEKNIRFEII